MLYAVRGQFVKGVVRLLMAPTPLYLHSERVRVTAHLAGGDPMESTNESGTRCPSSPGAMLFWLA